jgi:salicylate hydroxylase
MTSPAPDDIAEAALARAGAGDAAGPVLIAGGGIGGLAAALALARKKIPSHVLERRAAFEEEGAGIQLGPNGTRILAELGVAEALEPCVGVPEAIAVRDGASGDELARLPLGSWIAERHGAPYWVAHRADLHRALRETAEAEPLIAISLDFAVAGLASDARAVAAAEASGETVTGRALIAADGVWSIIRERAFRSGPPRFAGRSAARTVLPVHAVPPVLRAPETALWLFPDAHVVHYPVSAGKELAIVVIADDSGGGTDWSTPAEPAWVRERLPACAAPLRDLLGSGSTWRKWALQEMPMPREWARGLIALLGDAAHPVFPFLAQGGVLALEDAVVLADALSERPDDVAGALAAYARRRRPRALRVAEASRRNGRIYHMSGLPAAARNLVLRATPPKLLMARYDWLYGWSAR